MPSSFLPCPGRLKEAEHSLSVELFTLGDHFSI